MCIRDRYADLGAYPFKFILPLNGDTSCSLSCCFSSGSKACNSSGCAILFLCNYFKYGFVFYKGFMCNVIIPEMCVCNGIAMRDIFKAVLVGLQLSRSTKELLSYLCN